MKAEITVKFDNVILNDLNHKLIQQPALSPYIVAKIAGLANIKVAVPGILSGSVPGFGVRGGRTRRDGLKVTFKNSKGSFNAFLGTPLFNIFVNGAPSRNISPVPLWESFNASFQASGISEEVIKQALDDFDNNRLPDVSKYTALGIRRRR